MFYKPISFLTAYKVLLASSSAGVYFCTRVTVGVAGRAYLIQMLLAVAAVRKVGV